ncbi:hypothetical protein ACFR99_18895 [Haloarchaeobius amylolyticus]|uniref:Uncharacterized protein n=1 Tax=Haloarchaeobius amylolyticus TaxID=1198296 RepID=A0ABD6BKM3_9EURY
MIEDEHDDEAIQLANEFDLCILDAEEILERGRKAIERDPDEMLSLEEMRTKFEDE